MRNPLRVTVTYMLILGLCTIAQSAAFVSVPTDYATIQEAIDNVDVGGTVYVEAGTYTEDITIDKNITLTGEGENDTLLMPTGTGPIITVSVDDVDINGLGLTNTLQMVEGIRVVAPATTGLTVSNIDFTNMGNNPGPGNAFGINITNNFSGLNVSDCNFIATNLGEYSRAIGVFAGNNLLLSDFNVKGSTFAYHFVGIYLRSDINGLTATDNTFGPFEIEDCKAAVAGIYIGDGSQGNFDIQNITVTGNTFTHYGRGVYMWNYSHGDFIGQVDISDNTFTDTIWSSPIRFIGKLDPATQVATLEGPINITNNTFTQSLDVGGSGDVALISIRAGGESATSQINITDNDMTFNGPFVSTAHGMRFRGPVTNVTVSCNTLNGNNAGGTTGAPPSSSGIIVATDDSWLGPISSNAQVDISNNIISGFDNGVVVFDMNTNTYGNLPTGAVLAINDNSITGNGMGVLSGAGEITDANDNWWGDVSGPSGIGTGSGDPVSDYVSFTPWRTAEVLPCGSPYAPQCSTHEAKVITATSAKLSGALIDNGNLDCKCRYHYGPTGSAMITTDWSPIRYIDFTSVSDLLPNTEYSFQIEVRNGSGSDLAPVKTFTTQSLLTLGSTEGGSVVTPGEGSYDLDAGTVIDVEAQADQMSVFVAWTGSAVDAGLVADPNATATSVEVTGDLSLIAEFVAKPKVVWVTETRDIDSDGIQDDQDWVDLLVANGYYVMAEPDRYLTLGDQKDVNDANDYLGELNAADLVVISRSSSSGNYANDANEIANWNSVMTPMICLSAYHVRSSKLVWVDSTSIANDNLMPMMQVTDANHPLFEGVTLEEGGYITLVDTLIFGEDYQGTTFLAATDMGNATVLGTHLMTYPWIAEWTPGDEYYDGAGQMAGGKRMMFMAGTQETKTDPIYYPQGAMNLTDTGVQVFLNAVEYMIGFNPVDPGIDNLTHQYTFEDGTTADLVGGVDGVLYYDANIVDGALVCDGTDDYMDIDGPAVDVNSYEALTMVLWCAQTVDNSWTMTSCMGSTWDNGYGKNYVNVTSARGDQMNRGAIAITPDNDAPWGDEIGVSSPEMNDGIMHQYVLTIDATELAYYVDGALAGTAEMGDTSLSDLDNDYIYLGKGIYSVDGEWAGSIGSFSLYNKALTAQETLYLYLSGE